jgi:hypothetical protein
MGVRIDEPGQHGVVAEIDDACAGGHLDIGADRGDAALPYHDHLWTGHPSGDRVDQVSGADGNRGTVGARRAEETHREQGQCARYGPEIRAHHLRALDLFRVTAARTRVFNASAFIASPS